MSVSMKNLGLMRKDQIVIKSTVAILDRSDNMYANETRQTDGNGAGSSRLPVVSQEETTSDVANIFQPIDYRRTKVDVQLHQSINSLSRFLLSVTGIP